MSDLRETPLHDWHQRQGARMVPFAGWNMPVQYTGVVDEHTAVRERAGLFDVSHMGEVRLRGADALASIQRLTVNDASGLEPGRAQYTAFCDESGGVVDDLLVYCLAGDEYLLVVNAGTTAKDCAWIRRHLAGDVEAIDESAEWAQLAIQGPRSERILGRVLDVDLAPIGYYRFVSTQIGGAPAIVSRTGYTGEDGFEVYLRPAHAVELADALLEAGGQDGLVPAGLGARDTLRLEAGMCLYGSDMDESRTPLEAGLGWIVKLDKGEFIGRDALVRQKENGPEVRLVGLKAEGRGIPRHGYAVLDGSGAVIGEVTSGTFSPTLKQGIGLAYLAADACAADTQVGIDIRGRSVPARIVKPPFYRRPR